MKAARVLTTLTGDKRTALPTVAGSEPGQGRGAARRPVSLRPPPPETCPPAPQGGAQLTPTPDQPFLLLVAKKVAIAALVIPEQVNDQADGLRGAGASQAFLRGCLPRGYLPAGVPVRSQGNAGGWGLDPERPPVGPEAASGRDVCAVQEGPGASRSRLWEGGFGCKGFRPSTEGLRH